MEMTIESFLVLLFISSALTAIFTEGVKTVLQGKDYSTNVVAGIVAIVVTAAFSVGYCIMKGVTVTASAIVFFVALVAFSWLVSMIGYDKVKQCIAQLITTKTSKAAKANENKEQV